MKDKLWYKIVNMLFKILSWAVIVILVSICFLLVIYFFVSKNAQRKGEYPPVGLYTIISPSMTPNINVYDVVFISKVDPEKLKIGDVITFKTDNNFLNGVPITHRIIDKYNTNNGIQFKTKGDYNVAADGSYVAAGNVLGKVQLKIPQLGRIQFFLTNKKGWFIAIFIPAIGIIAYDIFKVIKLIMVKNKITITPKEEPIDKLKKELKTARRKK